MQNNNQVAFVTHTSEPGGAELALRRYLDASELPHTLITLRRGEIWEQLRDNGVQVNDISPSRPNLISDIWSLTRYLKKHRPPVLIANSMRSALYCALAKPKKTRLVYWVRDGLTNSAMSKTNLWITKYITIPKVESYIANSQWTSSSIKETSKNPNITVIPSPSGVTKSRFPHPRTNFLEKDKISLLYLGRIAEWKGIHHAIDALSMLNNKNSHKEYSLTIAGAALFDEKHYEKSLIQQVSDLGLNNQITFTGHVDDVHQLFSKHDILLHCSTVPEPFGQVIIQGLAAGIAVVATNAGGPKEIITHGVDGYLYTAGDTRIMANHIEKIVEKDQLRSLSSRAQSTASKFTDDVVTSALDKLIHTLSS